MRILPALVALALLAVAPAARAADQTLIWDHGCCAPQAIGVGDTVTFDTVVVDFGSHPLVWDTGDFATQSTDSSQHYTFATAGTYAFHCQFHSDMAGTITVGANAHPTVDFTFAPAEPKTGETVTFTATAADADGTVASYRWDLDGNGSFERTTTQPTITKVYSAAGTFAVKVQSVDNGHDASVAAVKSVPVAAAPGTNPGTPDTGGPAGGAPDGPGTTDGAGAGGSPQTTDGAVADTTAPTVGHARVSGGRLRLTAGEAATLVGVLRRGTHRVRALHARLRAGAGSLRLPAGLRRGRYSVRFTLTDASGNRSRSHVVTFRVR